MNDSDFPANQAKPNHQVDYVELPATDLAKTKGVYSNGFGWKFTGYGPEHTSFFDGRLGGGSHTRDAAPGTGIPLVIYAADLECTEARVKAAGGRIVQEIFSFPGGRRFHFADPSGNELAGWSD